MVVDHDHRGVGVIIDPTPRGQTYRSTPHPNT